MFTCAVVLLLVLTCTHTSPTIRDDCSQKCHLEFNPYMSNYLELGMRPMLLGSMYFISVTSVNTKAVCCHLDFKAVDGIVKRSSDHSHDFVFFHCQPVGLQVEMPIDSSRYHEQTELKMLHLAGCDVTWNDVANLEAIMHTSDYIFSLPEFVYCRDTMALSRNETLSAHMSTLTFSNLLETSTLIQEPRNCSFHQFLANIPYITFPNLSNVVFAHFDVSGAVDSYLQTFSNVQVIDFEDAHLIEVPNWNFTGSVQSKMPVTNRDPLDPDRRRAQNWQNSIEQEVWVKILLKVNQNTANLQHLSLSHNSISYVPNNKALSRLGILDISSNNLNSSSIQSLQNARNLTYLDVSHNAIYHLPSNVFDNFVNLHSVQLSVCMLSTIEGVTWKNTPSLISLQLSGNLMTSLDVSDTVRKIPNLLYLEASSNIITNMPYHSPSTSTETQLTYVDLFNNTLDVVPRDLIGVQILRLPGNIITSTGAKALTQSSFRWKSYFSRGSINLLYNCIEYIPLDSPDQLRGLSSVLSRYTIYLHENPLHCGCDEFKAWLRSKGVDNTQSLHCDYNSFWITEQKRLELRQRFPVDRCVHVGQMKYPYQCQADILLHYRLKVGLSITFTLCLLTIYIIVARRNIQWIKQFVFIYTGARIILRKVPLSSNLQYDAFVSYCSTDRVWVMDNIVRPLETKDPPYHLCIHDRDFTVGKDIGLNIMDNMALCKTVIMVLSAHFAKSEWCGFEVNAALEERILRGQSFCITPVTLSKDSYTSLTHVQRVFLRKMPKIKKGDRHFYRKLDFALGRPISIPERPIIGDVFPSHVGEQDTCV